MSERLEGKIVLVTGGGSGIGRASAVAFARAGAATVVVCDLVAESAEETVRLIKAEGGDGLSVRADVGDPGDVDSLVELVVSSFGRLDCAFNNAGVECEIGPMHESSIEDFHQTMRVNLLGTWLCMKREIAQMLAQGGGAIVNNASALGQVGFAGMANYSASKHAVIGLTRSAALEYATANVRINAVCPGVIRTTTIDRVFTQNPEAEQAVVGMQPIGRLGTPEEIASAAVWLCSPGASFMSGHAMAVDGGWLAR